MGLKTIVIGLILGASLGCATLTLPEIDASTLVYRGVYPCPDGPVQVHAYDQGAHVVISWQGSPRRILWVVVQKTPRKVTQIILDHNGRLEPLNEATLNAKYPTPCDLPRDA